MMACRCLINRVMMVREEPMTEIEDKNTEGRVIFKIKRKHVHEWEHYYARTDKSRFLGRQCKACGEKQIKVRDKNTGRKFWDKVIENDGK